MPPRLIFWETTAACNLRCVHCRRLDVLDQVSNDDLSTGDARAMITDIAQNFKPILVLSGGEPLFRSDILELASFARDRGLRVALATNGTLVTAEKARAIREAGVARVSISLDGAQAATHDRFRGAGQFDRAWLGFDHLKREGVSLQINMTVTRYNAHELPSLYENAVARGAAALHLFMLVPVGCGVQIADSDMLPSEEYEKWLHWFFDREVERKIELKATCAPHYFRIVRQRSKEIGGLPPAIIGKNPKAPHIRTRLCIKPRKAVWRGKAFVLFPIRARCSRAGICRSPLGTFEKQILKPCGKRPPCFRV
jgi:MoaA/NifB/PqqE/SkfB family radical SAM enzyme